MFSSRTLKALLGIASVFAFSSPACANAKKTGKKDKKGSNPSSSLEEFRVLGVPTSRGISLGLTPVVTATGTQLSPSLIGGKTLLNAVLFLPDDIVMKDEKLVGEIPYDKAIGFANSVCTITDATTPDVVAQTLIKTTICDILVCFTFDDKEEECIFAKGGGTRDFQVGVGQDISKLNGVVIGGTGPDFETIERGSVVFDELVNEREYDDDNQDTSVFEAHFKVKRAKGSEPLKIE